MKQLLTRLIFIFIPIVLGFIAAFVITGCAINNSYRPTTSIVQITLDTTNFHRHLYITKTGTTSQGIRLHFFPENREDTFQNVIITYSFFDSNQTIFETQSALQLGLDGLGQTTLCHRLFPRIVRVSGTVTTRVYV